MKLYEILLRKVRNTQDVKSDEPLREESKIYNPISLECKLGVTVKIDALDFRSDQFLVKGLREHSVTIGRNTHKMVDYYLASNDKNIILRLVPDSDSKSAVSHRAMILSNYDSFEYDEGLHHSVLSDPSGKFNIDDPEQNIHEEFWRVNDAKGQYESRTKLLEDKDKDGVISYSEISSKRLHFWDFSRMTEIDGVETEEFLFIEMDHETGWFDFYRGTEINPERIDVF